MSDFAQGSAPADVHRDMLKISWTASDVSMTKVDISSASDEPWATERAEAVALADYLATCDDAEYVEYFEMFGIELGRE